MAADKKDVPWYTGDLNESDVDPEAIKLLEEYSHIPKDQVLKHIYDVRERAWEVFPYPCLGHWRFVHLSIQKNPAYPEIMQRVKNGEKFLDLACALGQELRKLAYDGAPTENLYGADLRMDFIDIGYDLFRDRSTLKTKFIEADIFDPNSALNQLNNKISIVFIGSFLHLFDWPQQFEVCKRIVALLDTADKKQNIILGRQVGHPVAKEYERHVHADEPQKTRFRHNPESLKELWDKVGEATGTKWETTAKLLETENFEKRVGEQWNPHGSTRLTFTVRRVVD